jgi:tRNA dimethylallyltransferase
MAPKSAIKPLVVIVGTTASGKSTLSLDLAQRFNGEIICADAWTIRRGADIGTAKPSIEEQQMVKHHLVDIVGPNDSFNAAEFKELASKAIEEINSRNKLPILVGGTGLYIDSVIYDYSFMPRQDKSQRNELEKLSLEELLELINDKKIDTSLVDINNKRRLIRLFETGGQQPKKQPIRENTLVIGIDIEREKLKERIRIRTQNMLDQGLEDEVRSLISQYGNDCEAMKAIGYYEWLEYIKGNQTIDEVLQSIEKDSLSLARRQKTWFKRNKSIQWFTAPVNLDALVDSMTTFLNN